MLHKPKSLDIFTQNIIVTFLGSSLVSFINLLYQLLIAHKLSLGDFAAFNSLLAIYMLFSTPLSTIQTAFIKYISEFNAAGSISMVRSLISGALRKLFIAAGIVFIIMIIISKYLIGALKINSFSDGYLLAAILGLSCLAPLFIAGLQGLELFGWFNFASILSGVLKLGLAYLFIALGYNIGGALLALLISIAVLIIISYIPLKGYFHLLDMDKINYKEIYLYLLPIAVSLLCYMAGSSFDMVLVRYFFSPDDSGLYSLAQMVGKIFLFLPVAISIVMLPRASGQKAQNLNTRGTLYKSLFYGFILSVIAILIYNIFPEFVLKILTGKVFFESIRLGRIFSISMSFYALLFILITYFLSIKDLRFIKYLVGLTAAQILAIILWHTSLIEVQVIVCIASILLFFVHLKLAWGGNE